MLTHKNLVHNKRSAEYVCEKLIDLSQWFQLEPLPDDMWLFTVKEENTRLLNDLVGGL